MIESVGWSRIESVGWSRIESVGWKRIESVGWSSWTPIIRFSQKLLE